MASATRRVLSVALLLAACGCSGSPTATTEPSTTVVTAPTVTAPTVTGDVLPRVDLIDDAVAALEAKLGAPQRYFEINATPRLVNLFVELNDGKLVQPWVYLDGELSSSAALDANGHSFAGTALDFDPAKVLSHVRTELPQSRPDVFFIEGGEGGVVRYSVTVTSQQGGQLVVVVGPDGTVKSVDT